VPGVAHLLYLCDQRPHTDRALVRHDLRPNVIAIGKDRCGGSPVSTKYGA
jgi:hypothetical protein